MPKGGNKFLSPQELITLVGLSEGDEVADLGCGSGGFFVVPFGERVGSTGVVYAVDIMPDALKTVESAAKQRNLTNVKTIWANLEIPRSTTIKGGSLDISFLINVLFQVKDLKAVIAEAARVTRKGGKMVVVDWLKGTQGFGPSESMRINPENIGDIVTALGFQKMRVDEMGDNYFVAIFKKI